jgi:hypothetical protein
MPFFLLVLLVGCQQTNEILITANPVRATLRVGETQQIVAVVTGTDDPSKKAITWGVCDGDGNNCIPGGNSVRGTVEAIGEDPSGNSIARYIAPASPPSPPDCTAELDGCSVVVRGQLVRFGAACFTRVKILSPGLLFPVLVSVTTAGLQGNPGELSAEPAVSATGRFVVFSSDASLAVGDGGRRDVFVRDTCVGATTGCSPSTVLISVADDGTPGNLDSTRPALSADGRFVAFESPADTLVPADTNGTVADILVRDRDTDNDGILDEAGSTTIVVVSRSSTGMQGNASSSSASISANGRFVAFESIALNLVAGDTNGSRDLFVHDRDSDEDGIFDEPGAISTVRVSVASDGSQANSNSQAPVLSADSRFVVFSSNASNLVPGDLNNAKDVFLHDRDTDGNGIFDEPGGTATIRVSVATNGTEANAVSGNPNLNSSGRFVVFTSNASNLVANDTNATTDVFLRDTCLGVSTGCTPSTVRVSLANDGSEANAVSSFTTDGSRDTGVSDSGRLVAFASAATNLVAGDENFSRDVFVRDTCLGVPAGCTPSTVRVSVAGDGTEANGDTFQMALTLDGRLVAFASDASNLVAEDNNGARDVLLTLTGFQE